MGKPVENIIEKLRKQTPLYTRIKVPLEMEYLNLMLPDNSSNEFKEEQWEAADKWATRIAEYLLEQIDEWEADGRPPRTNPGDKQPEEDPAPTP